MNNVIFRAATPDDSLEIAQLTIIAGGGIFEFLLEDLLKNNTLENVLASEIQQETGTLSYVNTQVAELNNKIIGIIKSTDPKEQVVTPEMKEFLSKKKLNWVKRFIF
ncbi:hypothetical protein [Cyanothece sp. BG0011]|uniref:hypothetical protein n=1 Tax=Cyanothece sp. BG0011 TaxID=2082950 RepID=UPI000D1DD6AD|nr:hypothetical protein [Cyanothece sp. BG0011]